MINRISKLPAFPLPPLGTNDAAIVTGGLCGLGLEIVRVLISKYKVLRVYVLDIVPSKCDLGAAVHYIKCDLSSPENVEVALSDVIARSRLSGAPVSVVVNNAGIRLSGSLLNVGPESLRKVFEVNTFAPARIVQRMISNHVETHASRRLSIVTVSSVLGALGGRNLLAYCASKAASTQFHEVVAQEVVDFPSIRMLLVTPGQLLTEMFSDLEPPKQFVAPVVSHVELAKLVLEKVNVGETGIVCEPFYANFGYVLKAMPWKVQQVAREFAEIDKKIKP